MIETPQAPKFDPSLRAKIILAASAVILWILLLLAGGSLTGWLANIDFSTYDFLIRSHPVKPAENIVIVAIDEKSINQLGSQRKWGREKYAALVKKLSDDEALVAAFDLLFISPSDKNDKRAVLGDAEFVAAINDDYAPFTLLASAISGGRLLTAFKPLDQIAGCAGVINVEAGVNGTVRSIPVAFTGIDAEKGNLDNFFGYGLYAAAAYEAINAEKDTIEIKLENNEWHIGKHRVPHGDFYPAFPETIGQVPRFSFVDVLNGKFADGAFRDKIVFIGSTVNPNDRFRVPTSRRQKIKLGEGIEVESNINLMPGVEFHATVASSLMQDNFIRVVDKERVNPFLLAMAALIIIIAITHAIPLFVRLALTALIIAGTVIAVEILWSKGIFIQLAIIPIASFFSSVIGTYYEIHIARLRNRGLKNIFGRYVSPDVMKKILSDPSRLSWSEDRDVTVLFCDIRAFTPMAENLEPAETLEVLNTYFEAATAAILSVGGSVDKFVGDEIMAVFNAPLDHENHSLAGLNAGLRIMQSLVKVNQVLAARELPAITVGIGIHSGAVVAGNIGSTVRTEYGIIGDTVNTAARMVSAARPGEILASEITVMNAGDSVISEKGDMLELKGKSKMVQVYRVTDIKGTDTDAS